MNHLKCGRVLAFCIKAGTRMSQEVSSNCSSHLSFLYHRFKYKLLKQLLTWNSWGAEQKGVATNILPDRPAMRLDQVAADTIPDRVWINSLSFCPNNTYLVSTLETPPPLERSHNLWIEKALSSQLSSSDPSYKLDCNFLN